MGKISWKPGTMLYPVPAVLVTSHHDGIDNVCTVSWAGTVCTQPPMIGISLRPERYSYELIKKSMEFTVNVPDKRLAKAVDFCGVRSGRDMDKFEAVHLNKERAKKVKAPLIEQCPISIECKVIKIITLGSHHQFIGQVVIVHVEANLLDKKGALHLEKAGLLCYNHGFYCIADKQVGTFGFSVKKKKRPIKNHPAVKQRDSLG